MDCRVQDPFWRLWAVEDPDNARHVARVVSNKSMELKVLRKLQQLQSPDSYAVPMEILPCSETSLVVMPRLACVHTLPWEEFDQSTMLRICSVVLKVRPLLYTAMRISILTTFVWQHRVYNLCMNII